MLDAAPVEKVQAGETERMKAWSVKEEKKSGRF
jgi:hypothetical protein